jgi:hypothetical protein
MNDFIKYPRTPHLQGSRLQPGDDGVEQVDVASLAGGRLIWEEKLDGANAALSFRRDGALRLQSRGHVLRGGGREAQFALFKAWAEVHRHRIQPVLGDRYIVFGEWCYAKHTIFYDQLPHYFLEFDVYDRSTTAFLSTPARRHLLKGLPIVPVPVVHEGPVGTLERLPSLRNRKAALDRCLVAFSLTNREATSSENALAGLRRLVVRSAYKSADWRASLAQSAEAAGLRLELVLAETDVSDLAEGLYLKHEEAGVVIGRYKFIRESFLQSVAQSGSHWQDRPVTPNQLAPSVDIFAAPVT